jgi:hypothetical protein
MASRRAAAGKNAELKKSAWLLRAIKYVEAEGRALKDEPSLPDASTLEFNDADYSWEVFTVLEALKDGMGNTPLPRSGGPLDQDPALMDDLIRWRSLVNTARRMRDGEEK